MKVHILAAVVYLSFCLHSMPKNLCIEAREHSAEVVSLRLCYGRDGVFLVVPACSELAVF